MITTIDYYARAPDCLRVYRIFDVAAAAADVTKPNNVSNLTGRRAAAKRSRNGRSISRHTVGGREIILFCIPMMGVLYNFVNSFRLIIIIIISIYIVVCKTISLYTNRTVNVSIIILFLLFETLQRTHNIG